MTGTGEKIPVSQLVYDKKGEKPAKTEADKAKPAAEEKAKTEEKAEAAPETPAAGEMPGMMPGQPGMMPPMR